MLPEDRKARRRKMVADVIQQEISAIILGEVNDPACEGTVVTGVKMNKDLSCALVTVRGRDGRLDVTERTVSALNHASSFIRRELRGRIDLKKIPVLKFVEDRGIVESVRIAQLLSGLNADNADAEEERSGKT